MLIQFNFICILAMIIVIPGIIMGQVDVLGDQVEKTAEVAEMDFDFSDVIGDLADIAGKPINLNKMKTEELNAIPFLTTDQRKGLYDYLETYGEVLTVYELQSIPGFDSVLIRKIQPFITIAPSSHTPALTPRNLARFGRHDLLLRYEQSFPTAVGYQMGDLSAMSATDNCYLGSPQRYYFRYNYTWFDKIKIGLAGEKDPGEQFFSGGQKSGMDFYTWFLGLSNLGILKHLVLGNFRTSYGLGLTFGSGLSLGSIPGFSMNVPLASGIRPGLGMNEGSYLRGLAATLKIKHIEASGFASYHPRDATVTKFDSTTSNVDEISSLGSTGYHRTNQELAKKNVLTELICGGNISYSLAPTQQLGFKIGLTGVYYAYSANVKPKIHPYNQFVFKGKNNTNIGFDYQLRYKRLYLFGEVSRSQNSGMAWLSGATITPDPRIGITLIYRDYHPDFQNLFSNAFGQNSLNANEIGIYAAINAAIHPKVNLSGYCDLFRFPWLKYRVDIPVNGQEFGLMATWQAAGDVLISMRFYQKNGYINSPSLQDQFMHKLVNNHTRSFRFNIHWVATLRLILKTRIEIKEAGNQGNRSSAGYLIYQEAQVKPSGWLESLVMRFALFDIPAYESRIYAYEPEVLYGYSVPAYQGKGIRCNLLIKFGFGRRVDAWVKGGISYYTDRIVVGTGLDQTAGNLRSELGCQLRIRL